MGYGDDLEEGNALTTAVLEKTLAEAYQDTSSLSKLSSTDVGFRRVPRVFSPATCPQQQPDGVLPSFFTVFCEESFSFEVTAHVFRRRLAAHMALY